MKEHPCAEEPSVEHSNDAFEVLEFRAQSVKAFLDPRESEKHAE